MKAKFFLIAIMFLISFSEFSFSQLNVQWSQIFSGPGDAEDQPVAMATDQSGNFYVTVSTSDSGTIVTYIATIKYNSAGEQQWISYYSGNGGTASGFDEPTGIAVDFFGNVYMIGVTAENGTNSDYLTVKYNSAGQQLWEANYTTPGSFQDIPVEVAIGDSGNVYVTGWAGSQGTTQGNFVTVKYDSTGTQKWASTFSVGVDYDDRATNIALDHSENIFVTGWSYYPSAGGDWRINTVKYNAGGAQQWAISDTFPFEAQSSDLEIDKNGNPIVAGTVFHGTDFSNEDWFVARYSANGQHSWNHIYNGPSDGTDYANKLISDEAGNVYATGVVFDSTVYENVLTVKYDSAGNVQWMQSYDGLGSDVDIAYQIFLDGNKNVFVTGITESAGFDFDYLILKYSNSGDLLWSFNQDDGINEDDYPVDAVLDVNGDVCVTGYYDAGTSYYDAQTIKFNAATGIGELNLLSGLSIFPNPVSDELAFAAFENISGIKVFDLLGREQSVLTNYPASRVDVSHLASGMYLMQCYDKAQNVIGVAEFLKQ